MKSNLKSQIANSAKFAEKRSREGLELFKTVLKDKGLIYDDVKYSYVNNHTPVTVVCPVHGEFTSQPRAIIKSKHCCPKAARIESDKGWELTTEQVITQFKLVHGDRYGYSKVVYKRDNEKVVIECHAHGGFEQTPGTHKKGYGCPKCSATMEELRIIKLLDENYISYKHNYTVSEFNIRKRFDFWVQGKFLLEFDGPQHYRPIFGVNKLEKQINSDTKANIWCKENNIPLLRIPYTWPWELQKKTILEWVEKFTA